MLDSIIKTAENLWHQIAGTKKEDRQQFNQPEQKVSEPGYVFFQLKPFKDNEDGISNRENLLRSMSSIKWDINFIVQWNSKQIKMYVWVPSNYKHYFENIFYSTYRTSELKPLSNFQTPKDKYFFHFKDTTEFTTRSTFSKDWSYIDPFKDILSVFNTVDQSSSLTITFTLRYSINKWFWIKFFENLSIAIKFFIPQKKAEEPAKEESKEWIDDTQIYISMSYSIEWSDASQKEIIKNNLVNVFQIFYGKGWLDIKYNTTKTHKMQRDQASNFFHVPTKVNYFQQLDYAVYRRLPAPLSLGTVKNSDPKELTIVGKTDFRWEPLEFGIKEEDKFRHMYIIWKTWTGKSTFLSNLIKSDIEAWNWVALLDPHGELVETIMEHIPKNRINDVILFDVSDDSFPVWFNLLQYKNQDEKMRVASWVVTTFKKLFWHSRWPRLEYILRNTLLSLVDYPNATLLHILRMYTDTNFREEVLSFTKDTMVLKFWRWEFDKWNDKQIQESIWPITNKVWQFLSSPVVRNIFWQPRAKLSLRDAMDSWKIILINLSKGKIWDDNAEMIWSLLVTKFQIDAMARADTKAENRLPFYLYIDEFQNFATESFATILSEARKYKLSLIVANQYTSQLLPEIRDAIFGNIWTIITFTLWYDDAKVISNQFKEMVTTNDLISLPRFTAYTRMMIDWVTSDPFSMKTLPLSTPHGSEEMIKKVVEQSRQRYAMEKNQLEKLMDAWALKNFSPQERVAERSRLEWLWLSEYEIKNLENPRIKQLMPLFEDYKIWKNEPDAMGFDLENWEHKAIWYTAPEWLTESSTLQTSSSNWKVNIYHHESLYNENNSKLEIWIATPQVIQSVDSWVFEAYKTLKFVRNLKKIEDAQALVRKNNPQDESVSVNSTQNNNAGLNTSNHSNNTNNSNNQSSNYQQTRSNTQQNSWWFTINDIVIGQEYEWYVKLVYNFGIFVTVKWVEWLLHKNFIKNAWTDLNWKKFYNIWDKIRAYASEFKEIKWEKKVVWSQFPPKQNTTTQKPVSSHPRPTPQAKPPITTK